jgi:hypothetical protein
MWTLTAWNLTDSNQNHIVQVCQDDVFQAEAVTRYIQEGLLKDEAVIIYARTSLRKSVIRKLEQLDIEVGNYKRLGQLKFFDVEYSLSCFYNEDIVNESSFQDFVGSSLQDLRLRFGKTRIFGEMVNVLWKNDEHEAAMKLEECWNNLSRQFDFSLLVSYSLDSIVPANANIEEAITLICQYHKHLRKVNPSNPSMIDRDSVLGLFVSTWNHINDKIAVTNPLPEDINFSQ